MPSWGGGFRRAEEAVPGDPVSVSQSGELQEGRGKAALAKPPDAAESCGGGGGKRWWGRRAGDPRRWQPRPPGWAVLEKGQDSIDRPFRPGTVPSRLPTCCRPCFP